MRSLFFGTPEFAVPSLRALSEISDVAAVVCQPDKRSGRGKKLSPPPTKVFAMGLGCDLHQPTKLRAPELVQVLQGYQADVAVVVAYGRILPPAILRLTPNGCVNVHASLLPRWRGAAPIQWAIASGDAKTGISLMQLDEGMDTGPVFSTTETKIGVAETAGELSERLSDIGAAHLRRELPNIVSGELRATPQPEDGVTYARLLVKSDGELDFSATAAEVVQRVRAMNPWPGGMTFLGAERIRVHRAGVSGNEAGGAAPGTVLPGDGRSLMVACKNSVVELQELQLDGKRRADAADFLRGHPVAAGSQLGMPPGA